MPLLKLTFENFIISLKLDFSEINGIFLVLKETLELSFIDF
jgi:hypothetical protein